MSWNIFRALFNKNRKNSALKNDINNQAEDQAWNDLRSQLKTGNNDTTKVTEAIATINKVCNLRFKGNQIKNNDEPNEQDDWYNTGFVKNYKNKTGLPRLAEALNENSNNLEEQVRILATGKFKGTNLIGWGSAWNSGFRDVFKSILKSMNGVNGVLYNRKYNELSNFLVRKDYPSIVKIEKIVTTVYEMCCILTNTEYTKSNLRTKINEVLKKENKILSAKEKRLWGLASQLTNVKEFNYSEQFDVIQQNVKEYKDPEDFCNCIYYNISNINLSGDEEKLWTELNNTIGNVYPVGAVNEAVSTIYKICIKRFNLKYISGSCSECLAKTFQRINRTPLYGMMGLAYRLIKCEEIANGSNLENSELQKAQLIVLQDGEYTSRPSIWNNHFRSYFRKLKIEDDQKAHEENNNIDEAELEEEDTYENFMKRHDKLGIENKEIENRFKNEVFTFGNGIYDGNNGISWKPGNPVDPRCEDYDLPTKEEIEEQLKNQNDNQNNFGQYNG